MIEALEDLDALLKETELENSTIVQLEIPECSNCAFAIKVSSEKTFRAWELFRSLVDEVGRYPVLIDEACSASDNWEKHITQENLFSRRYFEYESFDSEVKSCSPEVIISKSQSINLTQEIEKYQQKKYWCSLEEQIDRELEFIATWFGITPSKESILSSIQTETDYVSNGSIIQLEKWLFNWECEHFASDIPYDLLEEAVYLDWYPPEKSLDYTLILLPTVYSWEALAYIHWDGSIKSELMIAALQSWHERFQAELVAQGGLNFC